MATPPWDASRAGTSAAEFEIDIGPSTAAPADINHYDWVSGTPVQWEIIYDATTRTAQFCMGGVDVTYALPAGVFANNVNGRGEITFRTRAVRLNSTMLVDNLVLTVNGQPVPDIPTSLGPTAGDGLDTMFIPNQFIQLGFTLTGRATLTWSNANPPTRSQLAFQIGFNESLLELVDAQGFGPQLNNGVPTLQTPLANAVDAAFDRRGSLTDGASLVVMRFDMGTNPQGWTVTLTDPANTTHGAAQLGSLWQGDQNNLPMLPATLANPGNDNLTLTANDAEFFFRAPPSWDFGSSNMVHTIQVQVHNQNNELISCNSFELVKPSLVLVHGGVGFPSKWDNFQSILDVRNIEARFVVADYAQNNNNFSGLDNIYKSVPTALINELNRLRYTLEIAATRLDIVAHSAGGLATRWYMTPIAQRPTGHRIDPNLNLIHPPNHLGLRVLPLRFKATEIDDTTLPIEFRRADNYGIGDIRRMITLGTPHRGMTAWRQVIKVLNAAVDRQFDRKRHRRVGTSFIESVWGFHVIHVDEPGEPGQRGMMILDLAVFDDFDTNGTGPISRVLDGLAPIPIPYAPIEGQASGGRLAMQWNACCRNCLYGLRGWLPPLLIRSFPTAMVWSPHTVLAT